MSDQVRDAYDVVVIGGGAAGLNGALQLARSRRSVLVVDAGQQRNLPAAGIHGLLGRGAGALTPGPLLPTAQKGQISGAGGSKPNPFGILANLILGLPPGNGLGPDLLIRAQRRH